MAAARRPAFYAAWAVPDTVDGRFDLIALHTFLVLDRLKGDAPEFRQKLVDEFFSDMDRSLREMGVGDLSVGKKVRKMAEVFYGRVAAYDAALAGADDGALRAAITRNVFPEAEEGAIIAGAGQLAGYVLAQRRHLARQQPSAITAGVIDFEEPKP